MFTTMISWMQYNRYHFAHLNNHLLIYTEKDNQLTFRPPIGKPDTTIFQQVLELAQHEGGDYPLGVIEEPTKKWMQNTYPKLKFRTHRNFFDYVYLISDLAELAGSKYSKIRNRLNKFTKIHTYTIEPLTEENAAETKQFLRRWCLWKDCESDEILAHEKKAVFYSMNHFFDLGLSGILMRVNNNVEAIAVYERLNPETAVVHYEKASPYFDGIYKAINMETAKKLRNEYTYINRQEDMGIPGLRKAKQAYRPHHLVEVSHITKKDLIF